MMPSANSILAALLQQTAQAGQYSPVMPVQQGPQMQGPQVDQVPQNLQYGQPDPYAVPTQAAPLPQGGGRMGPPKPLPGAATAADDELALMSDPNISDDLMDALLEQERMSLEMEPTQSRRFSRGLFGAGEAIFDAIQRERKMPEYLAANERAAEETRKYQAQKSEAREQRIYVMAKDIYGDEQARAIAMEARDNPAMAEHVLTSLTKKISGAEEDDAVTADRMRQEQVARTALVQAGYSPEQAAQYGRAVSEGLITMDTLMKSKESGLDVEALQQMETDLLNLEDAITTFYNPLTGPAIGPVEGTWAGKTRDVLMGNQEVREHRRRLEQIVTEEYLEFGGKVLKGAQSEREWQEVAKTRPRINDDPGVWEDWIDKGLRVIERDAVRNRNPVLLDQVDRLRMMVDQNRGAFGAEPVPGQSGGADGLTAAERQAALEERLNLTPEATGAPPVVEPAMPAHQQIPEGYRPPNTMIFRR